MPPPRRDQGSPDFSHRGHQRRGARGSRYWQWCIACEQPMNEVYACATRRCLALYCCVKCADFDQAAGFHPQECAQLDVPEMFLHRVAVRSQDKKLPKLIIKKTREAFIEVAEGLIELSTESNTAYCDAVMKWAKFRGEKDLILKAQQMKRKFDGLGKRSGTRTVLDKEALPDWDTLCRGLEKEKKKTTAIDGSSKDLFPDSDDDGGKPRRSNGRASRMGSGGAVNRKVSTPHGRDTRNMNSSFKRVRARQ